jgi:hypothetical protein
VAHSFDHTPTLPAVNIQIKKPGRGVWKQHNQDPRQAEKPPKALLRCHYLFANFFSLLDMLQNINFLFLRQNYLSSKEINKCASKRYKMYAPPPTPSLKLAFK